MSAAKPNPNRAASLPDIGLPGKGERFVRRCPKHHVDLLVDVRSPRRLPCPQRHTVAWWEVWDREHEVVVALGGDLEGAFLGFIGEPPTPATEAFRRGPSPHLTWTELACKDGTPYPAGWRELRAVPLALEFEIVRAMCGDKPIYVLSGYRTATHNAKVGGARNSQHVMGRALDLGPPAGMTLDRFAAVVQARAAHLDSYIRGIGIYPRFVHVDIRPADELVTWNGARVRADLSEAA